MSSELETNKAVETWSGIFKSKHEPYKVVDRNALFDPHGLLPHDWGVQYLFRFDNGYGASLISGSGSYGFEIAVIEWDSPDSEHYDLTYETPVTSEVLGWLDLPEIESTLDAIKALPSSTKELES